MSTNAARSPFVTTVAWIFLALSGFGMIVSLLQNVMLRLFPAPSFAHGGNAPPGFPAPLAPLLDHMAAFAAAVLVVMVVTFACALGLLLRKNWARLGFVALLLLGIAWNVAGFAIQVAVMTAVRQQAGTPELPAAMSLFFIVILVVMGVFALGLSTLYGWIARRLLAPAIAAEFDA